MRRISLFAAIFLILHFNILGQEVKTFDIVIDEFMADPTPLVGLPNNEWMELKNVSSTNINLTGFRIGNANGQSGPMPNFILKPDSFVIVCTGSAVAAMNNFGPTISVTSFPTLNNSGDIIFLRSPQGKIIHTVNYSIDWYQNELKKDGGWSLEMMDTKNPCSGFSNWKPSVDPIGGTPGRKNSVDANNPDKESPQLLKAFATDSLNIVLVFDEPLDSLKAATALHYQISDGVGNPQTVITISPTFDRVNLKLNAPLSRNKIYTITASSISDCSGNTIENKNTARVGLSEFADSMDIVINEILFNPKPNSVDYVEIYNRSNKIIDLKQLFIANRNSLGVISNIKQISAENYLLFPQEFMVLTEEPGFIKRDYVTKNRDAFVKLVSMPSFNNDKGNAIILNMQGNIIDELQYDEKWQFKLIGNDEGVALERINYDAPTQQQDNWHSAASGVGYGTPTYKNSQFKSNYSVKGEVKLSPEIFSPDNDGIDDFATLDYNFPDAGYVANITIFDAVGRVVRYLQRNALCGTVGSFRWDGLGENYQKLPMGIYIIYTEVFNLKGDKKQFKNVVVLARR